MPRSPRIEYADAVYHVMSRGMRGENIFLDDRDREIFLRTLDETLEQTGWFIRNGRASAGVHEGKGERGGADLEEDPSRLVSWRCVFS